MPTIATNATYSGLTGGAAEHNGKATRAALADTANGFYPRGPVPAQVLNKLFYDMQVQVEAAVSSIYEPWFDPSYRFYSGAAETADCMQWMHYFDGLIWAGGTDIINAGDDWAVFTGCPTNISGATTSLISRSNVATSTAVLSAASNTSTLLWTDSNATNGAHYHTSGSATSLARTEFGSTTGLMCCWDSVNSVFAVCGSNTSGSQGVYTSPTAVAGTWTARNTGMTGAHVEIAASLGNIMSVKISGTAGSFEWVRSTNGGTGWTTGTVSTGGVAITNLRLVAHETGFLLAARVGTSNLYLYKWTSAGGWVLQSTTASPTALTGRYLAHNQARGITAMLSTGSQVNISNDAGATWSKKHILTSANTGNLFEINRGFGYCNGASSGNGYTGFLTQGAWG